MISLFQKIKNITASPSTSDFENESSLSSEANPASGKT